MENDNRPFEAVYHELEETVQRLESGELSLADSLALFERGAALAEQCNALLDNAELRVSELLARPDGTVSTQPFDGWQAER